MKTILITGASSGIGQALAVLYARRRDRLFLAGRSAERLAAVAEQCRALGADVHTQVVDVTAKDILAQWILDADRRFELDLVLANAGISGGTGGVIRGEMVREAEAIFAVNFTGVLNTIHPILPRMMERRRGQVAIVSSLAGIFSLPGAPAYSASKAAVRYYGEALRGHVAPVGVRVNVICPGFVVSRMTARNRFPMPFLMSAERAASLIARGLDRNEALIRFPWPMILFMTLLSMLPFTLRLWLLTRLPEKGEL